MNQRDFEIAAELTREGSPTGYIQRQYGRQMRRLVVRLRNLPTWEQLRPTPELAEREWNKMVHQDTEVRRMQRKTKRQQSRFP
jgi:hypothetical protein